MPGTPYASSTDPSTWRSFEDACAVAAKYGLDIGYVISANDPFACVDLDVKETTTQENIERHLKIVAAFDSFTERSRSGIGLHIWVEGKIGQGARRDGVEIYSQERFIICTGDAVDDKAISNRQDILNNMVSQMRPETSSASSLELVEVPQQEEDDVVLERATGASNNEKFELLWGGKWQDKYASQSEADMALIGILCFYSRSNEQVRRLFRLSELGKREKATKNDRSIDYCLQKIRGRQSYEREQNVQYQIDLRQQLKAIGEGALEPRPMPSLTLEQMLEQCVFVAAKSNVAWADKPTVMYPMADARNVLAASKTEVMIDKKLRLKPTLALWLEDSCRITVETVTFDPRYGDFCADPDGHRGLNLYRPRPHTVPNDWAVRVLPFLEHVAYLVPVEQERERFVDWLAHIEQQPGKLPHSGYLMIATSQGVGRNWMAGVLASVWRGHVALDFDLAHVLSSGFNGRLSQKFLAVVDEINEGVQTDQWRHNEKLKSMVTAEVRNINPKFGFERVEHNCCRWLMFSNHESAIPLKNTDRRWNVIRNPNTPRDSAYYAALYELLEDSQFVASVREFFRQRDLSAFNPGARPILNDAKLAVIESTRSEADERTLELVRSHPCDLITGDAFCHELYGEKHTATDHGKLKHRAAAAGIEKWKGNGGGRIRTLLTRQTTVWILRNQERWAHANTDAVMQELRQPIPR